MILAYVLLGVSLLFLVVFLRLVFHEHKAIPDRGCVAAVMAVFMVASFVGFVVFYLRFAGPTAPDKTPPAPATRQPSRWDS